MPGGVGQSWFMLELDTTPPVLTLGEARLEGAVLVVPYRVNEPVTLQVSALDADGAVREVDIRPTEIRVDVGTGQQATLDVVAVDEVDNRRAVHETISVSLVWPMLPPGRIPHGASFIVLRGGHGGEAV